MNRILRWDIGRALGSDVTTWRVPSILLKALAGWLIAGLLLAALVPWAVRSAWQLGGWAMGLIRIVCVGPCVCPDLYRIFLQGRAER